MYSQPTIAFSTPFVDLPFLQQIRYTNAEKMRQTDAEVTVVQGWGVLQLSEGFPPQLAPFMSHQEFITSVRSINIALASHRVQPFLRFM
jgi:hypothetical protein